MNYYDKRVNEAEVDFYKCVLMREAVDNYFQYTEICFHAFGKHVTYWLAINDQNRET